MARKKKKKKSSAAASGKIRQDILRLLQQSFPDGVVEVPGQEEGSYRERVFPELKSNLLAIGAVNLRYEESCDTQYDPYRWDDDDMDELPLDDVSRSYWRLFLAPPDPEFRHSVSSPVADEADELIEVEEEAQVGYLIGLSLAAPVAIVRLTEVVSSEEYGCSMPDVFDATVEPDVPPAERVEARAG